MSRAALGVVLRETVRRNRVRDGLVYLQVTRGVAPRDHFLFPARRAADRGGHRRAGPSRADMARRRRSRHRRHHRAGQPLGRVDIKTVGLLPNCLAKQAAKDAARARPGSSTRRLRHRGRLLQRLDRRPAAGVLRHPAGRRRHPARRHPHGRLLEVGGAAEPRGRGAAVHPARRPRRRAEAFITSATHAGDAGGAHRRPRRSATASRAASAHALRAAFHRVAEIAP